MSWLELNAAAQPAELASRILSGEIVPGVWILAGPEPSPGVYPCRCHERSPWGASQCGPGPAGRPSYCPCYGRTRGIEFMPPECCGRMSLRSE